LKNSTEISVPNEIRDLTDYWTFLASKNNCTQLSIHASVVLVATLWLKS